jgi:hypothetical protein
MLAFHAVEAHKIPLHRYMTIKIFISRYFPSVKAFTLPAAPARQASLKIRLEMAFPEKR